MAEIQTERHDLSLNGRAELNLTGVRDVCAFDTETLLLDTVMGRLTVKGEGLKITAFHHETGDFSATGKFHALAYSSTRKEGSRLGRLFR